MPDDEGVAPAGVPDGFERLWVPHRMVYVGGAERPATSEAKDCPFCRAPGGQDREGLIVARGQAVYALLNLFPYNPGPLLICPYRHISDLTEASEAEAAELMAFSRLAMAALRRASGPAGFNLGLNQGAVAGAGIEAHLHTHVVPRWSGDANFFPIIARTRALPQVLAETRDLVADAWRLEAEEAGAA
jgi:ATP adenylyltransferase